MITECLFIHLSFSDFLQQCFVSSRVQVFMAFITFIPRYLVLPDTVMNRIIFLSSFLDCSLLSRHKADFCVLTLRHAVMQNSFISSSHHVLDCFLFSLYIRITSSAKRDSFTSFFYFEGLCLFSLIVLQGLQYNVSWQQWETKHPQLFLVSRYSFQPFIITDDASVHFSLLIFCFFSPCWMIAVIVSPICWFCLQLALFFCECFGWIFYVNFCTFQLQTFFLYNFYLYWYFIFFIPCFLDFL